MASVKSSSAVDSLVLKKEVIGRDFAFIGAVELEPCSAAHFL